MSYMNPVYGEPIALSEAASFLGDELCTLDEPVRLKWRLGGGEWYFAVAKYYSKVGIAFERIQDHYKYIDIWSNSIVELEDGRRWSAEGKTNEDTRISFLEFFNSIAQEQRQRAVIQDEDEDFVV